MWLSHDLPLSIWPNDAKLIQSAVKGMLAGLNPHSTYMDAKRFRDLEMQTRGEFGGLDIELTMDALGRHH
jgi:carboxyl-terminal processing protease